MVRFAGGARVFKFLALVVAHHGHRLITERIVGVLTDNKHTAGTGWHTISATVTLVRIDGDKELTRTILISIVRYHDAESPIPNRQLAHALRRLVSKARAKSAPPRAPAI